MLNRKIFIKVTILFKIYRDKNISKFIEVLIYVHDVMCSISIYLTGLLIPKQNARAEDPNITHSLSQVQSSKRVGIGTQLEAAE